MARSISGLVVHCSATRPAMDIGVAEIRQWHMKPKSQGGLGARDVGYHYVIRRNGLVEAGRKEAIAGAHVAGHNANTIGICLVGGVKQDDFRKAENNFTAAQFASLKSLLTDLSRRYPGAVVKGHRDFKGVHKACPSFDAKAWAKAAGFRV